jgi:hypothetical protein
MIPSAPREMVSEFANTLALAVWKANESELPTAETLKS